MDLREAAYERLAIAADVQILNVQDFEPRLPHQTGGIERRIERNSGFLHQDGEARFREQSAFGVAVDVEFDLADAGIQLDRQGRVRIIERVRGLRIGLPQVRHLVRAEPRVVAIVAPDDLDLIDPQRLRNRLRAKFR